MHWRIIFPQIQVIDLPQVSFCNYPLSIQQMDVLEGSLRISCSSFCYDNAHVCAICTCGLSTIYMAVSISSGASTDPCGIRVSLFSRSRHCSFKPWQLRGRLSSINAPNRPTIARAVAPMLLPVIAAGMLVAATRQQRGMLGYGTIL